MESPNNSDLHQNSIEIEFNTLIAKLQQNSSYAVDLDKPNQIIRISIPNHSYYHRCTTEEWQKIKSYLTERKKVKFAGKPPIKNAGLYYLLTVGLKSIPISVGVALFLSYSIWDTPTWIQISLWVVLALTIDDLFFMQSYKKYRHSFIEQHD